MRRGKPDLIQEGLVRRGGEPEAVFAQHFTQNEHQWSYPRLGRLTEMMEGWKGFSLLPKH